MTNEEYYDYYEYVNTELRDEYESTVGAQRTELLEKLLETTGAIAYTSNNSWGGSETIRDLVFPIETPLKEMPHIKTVRITYFEGKRVIVLSGKKNQKAGVEFNKPLDETRNALKQLPDFKYWIVSKLGVHRTGVGGVHSSGRGQCLLSTDFAMREGVYYFTIPNDNCTGASAAVKIPKEFKKLSYGQFYDATH
jgi:hypothetical protein